MNPRQSWYDQIEAEHGFKLPAEYITLADRGAFDVPEPSGNYIELVDSSYLWVSEMEWRPLPDVRDHAMPVYCKPGFVSFAFTGGLTRRELWIRKSTTRC
jgi:hypothetical protein